MLKTLNVGIDVSHQQHSVCLLDEAGGVVGKPFRVANNAPGAQALARTLEQASVGYDQVLVGLEATGLYWWHFYLSLVRSANPASPWRVVVFNPKVIRGFREAFTSMEKTDPKDAHLIADRLRFGRLPDYPPPDPRYFPLQRLTRYRFHLVRTLVRTKAHALTLLFLYASEYERLAPFKDPFSATSLAILSEQRGLDAVAGMPLAELIDFLETQGRHNFKDPAGLARLLKQVVADTFPLDQDAVEPVHFALSSALGHIRFLGEQLQTLDRRIAQELTRFPNTLLSVPGIGPVYAAGLIAEIGDIHRFPDEDALAKYAGLWWPRHQTGQFEGADRPLSKAGNRYLRYYLCEAANSLRLHNETYRQFYERKYQETPKHPHKRACVLTARKLVRLVAALLRTHQLWHSPEAVSPTKPKPRR